jgi:hypothetical protein
MRMRGGWNWLRIVADFGINGVEPSGSASRVLVTTASSQVECKIDSGL